MVKTYGQLYRQVKYALEEEEGPMAPATARILLSHVTEKSTAELMAMEHLYVSPSIEKDYLAVSQRVLDGEPLAYILGTWSFYGLELTVTPDVLIPRDDTMAVVDLALEHRHIMPKGARILDLCTGSGCIGLALASQISDAKLTLADLSPKALKIAKLNAANLHLNTRVSCIQADATKPASKFLGQFDMIISNPPYITKAEMKDLQRSVRDYEPHMALDGGEDGLDFYRAIVENYSSVLKPEGFLCFEFGMGQERAVCELLKEHGYEVLRLRKDGGDIIRAVIAKKLERNQDYGEEKE